MPPRELLAAGRREVTGYGGELIDGRVAGIEPVGTEDGKPLFEVVLEAAPSLRARRLIVTTGLGDEVSDVPGVRERWGRDLLHCPYCHGNEVRDQPLGVLGGTLAAVDARAPRQAVVSRPRLLRHGRPMAEQREQSPRAASASWTRPSPGWSWRPTA